MSVQMIFWQPSTACGRSLVYDTETGDAETLQHRSTSCLRRQCRNLILTAVGCGSDTSRPF